MSFYGAKRCSLLLRLLLFIIFLVLFAGCGRNADTKTEAYPANKSLFANQGNSDGTSENGTNSVIESDISEQGMTDDASADANQNTSNESTQNQSQNGSDNEGIASVQPSAYVGISQEPTFEALSVFPGVLRVMTLEGEDVLQILGPGYEKYENVSQAYSVFTWNDLDLTLEYDSLTEKVRAIRIGTLTCFLAGAEYRQADLNNDGVLEGICSFEAFPERSSTSAGNTAEVIKKEGRVVVIDEASGQTLGESFTKPFGGYSSLSFLLDYGAKTECLIILDTESDWECDVFTYKQGQLISVLPDETLNVQADSNVTYSFSKPESVRFDMESVGLAFQCLLPERLQDALEKAHKFEHRFVINRKPMITDDGLTLKARYSLQVLLGQVIDIEGIVSGLYIDIGQLTQEFRYMGDGIWKLLKTEGSPKYTSIKEGSDTTIEDMMVGPAVLFSSLYDYTETFGLDPKDYVNADLIGGIAFQSEGLRIKVVNARIANIIMGETCLLETPRGLKTGDTKGEALALYGQPDAGYFEDKVWKYWFYRDFYGQKPILSQDFFSINFIGDRISEIEMSAYIPID